MTDQEKSTVAALIGAIFSTISIVLLAICILIAITVDAKAIERARTASFLANSCEIAVPLVENGSTGKTREEAAALSFCAATFMSVTDMLSDMHKICLPEGETYLMIAETFVFKHRSILSQADSDDLEVLNSVSFIYPVMGHLLGEYKCEKEPVKEFTM